MKLDPSVQHYDLFAKWAKGVQSSLNLTWVSANHAEGFYWSETQQAFHLWWAGWIACHEEADVLAAIEEEGPALT